MENKPKKIVTGLYVTTIIGYVVVGFVLAFSLYLGVSFLFGVFNRANIDLTGVQFKDQESDITIFTEGGTAEVTLFSPDGILQERIAEDAANNNEENVKTAVYKVETIEITVQDDKGKVLNPNESPIKLPNMSEIHMGKPFTIEANKITGNGDEAGNIGGDCYLVAKVVDNEGKIYLTKNPLHVFVDVPIKKIKSVRAKPVVNTGTDVIVHDDTNTSFDAVKSNMYVDDQIELEIEVCPARALQPHTADKYLVVDSDSHVPPKSIRDTVSDSEIFNVGADNKIKFLKNVTSGSNQAFVTVYVNSIYSESDSSFVRQNRVIKFEKILTPKMKDFVMSFSSPFDEEASILNVDLHVPQTEPTLCLISSEFDVNDITNGNDNLTTYIDLLNKEKVVNLDVKISAGGSEDGVDYPRASFNTLYPQCLQSLVSGFNISPQSYFYDDDEGKVIASPDWIVNNVDLKSPIRIEKLALGSADTDPSVWFVYVERELEEKERANIIFKLRIDDDTDINKPWAVNVRTKPVNQTNVGWKNLVLDSEITFNESGNTTTYACAIEKDGDLATNVQNPISIPLKYKLDSDATYTRLIYLVKTHQGGGTGQIADYNLNYNSVGCMKVMAEPTSIYFGGDTYNMLVSTEVDGSLQYQLNPVGAGAVDIYPFIVKTNLNGEPIDWHYRVIENGEGVVKSEDLTNGINYDNHYIILPVSDLNNQKKYELDKLTVIITEELTGFKFYDSASFSENISTYYYDGSSPLFVLGNSSLALSQFADTAGFEFAGGVFSFADSGAVKYFQLSNWVNSLNSISISKGSITAEIGVVDVRGYSKSIVFKDNANSYSNNATIDISESVVGSNSLVDNLDIYYENAEKIRPYYKGTQSGKDDVYWHSSNIKTEYLLLDNSPTYVFEESTKEEDDRLWLTREQLMELYVNGSLALSDEDGEHTIEWEPGNSDGSGSGLLIDGELNQAKIELDDGFYVIDPDYGLYGPNGGLATVLRGRELNSNVTDKIQTKNGVIYSIDEEVLNMINTGTYKLYCVAFEDIDDLGPGKIAFMEINVNTLETNKKVQLDKYSVYNEDEEGDSWYCWFNSENLYQVNIAGVNVHTTLGLEVYLDLDLRAIGDELLQSNCASGNNITFDNINYVYVLQLKNGYELGTIDEQVCLLGTINLKVNVRRGTYVNESFRMVGEFEIPVQLRLILMEDSEGGE